MLYPRKTGQRYTGCWDIRELRVTRRQTKVNGALHPEFVCRARISVCLVRMTVNRWVRAKIGKDTPSGSLEVGDNLDNNLRDTAV